MSRTELLSRVPLFTGLEREDLEKLGDAIQEESFDPGESIVEIGESGHSLYVIVGGSVQVLYPARSQDFELARLGRGDFFGEMALLNEKPRSATVKAVDPVEVLVLEKSDFQRIVRESPSVAFKLLEVMSVRMRSTDQQVSDLSDLAMRDQLTGLLNRRAFHERFREEVDRSSRYDDTFSLILLDVDRFKSVNESFGHEVGDAILAWIGRILTEHTRSADVAFRVGGEEFALLAPATTGDTAQEMCTRLLETVAEASPPVDMDIKITVSGGFASCPEHATRSDALFNLADDALLRAKADGRNRVCAPASKAPLERAQG